MPTQCEDSPDCSEDFELPTPMRSSDFAQQLKADLGVGVSLGREG